jgi:starch synthase (maltosyl-transferring)
MWAACRDILIFWAEHGVRTFRVDNPHTKPLAFWEWVIREVHGIYPDVVFLSESFTRPNRMKSLAKLGFNQSYTYFTWKNSAQELKEFFGELTHTSMVEYYRPNCFANTPAARWPSRVPHSPRARCDALARVRHLQRLRAV